jgi:hypothetical protein
MYYKNGKLDHTIHPYVLKIEGGSKEMFGVKYFNNGILKRSEFNHFIDKYDYNEGKYTNIPINYINNYNHGKLNSVQYMNENNVILDVPIDDYGFNGPTKIASDEYIYEFTYAKGFPRGKVIVSLKDLPDLIHDEYFINERGQIEGTRIIINYGFNKSGDVFVNNQEIRTYEKGIIRLSKSKVRLDEKSKWSEYVTCWDESGEIISCE